jgi:hypothetical protein
LKRLDRSRPRPVGSVGPGRGGGRGRYFGSSSSPTYARGQQRGGRRGRVSAMVSTEKSFETNELIWFVTAWFRILDRQVQSGA